ncbi:hypothetical protein EZS27_023574 [termite gut metagenome]|uniref:Bacteriophage lambda Replication protein O N-terminal domain-containing protein n=1 Tax=termite gut metagenome TaxID=433724 RepID=A0A5J4R0E5_9ZZZZ
MTYIELINRFWKLNKECSFTAYETQMYFKLLDTCNSLGWKNPFAQSNDCLSGELGISKRKLIQLKNSLKQYGLIEFQSGKVKRELTRYAILGCAKVIQNDTPNITQNIIQNGSNRSPNLRIRTRQDMAGAVGIRHALPLQHFTPPLLEEVKNYISQKGYQVDAETFVAFYTSKNWLIGKNKMKDWQAALLTWHKRQKEPHSSTSKVNEIWEK